MKYLRFIAIVLLAASLLSVLGACAKKPPAAENATDTGSGDLSTETITTEPVTEAGPSESSTEAITTEPVTETEPAESFETEEEQTTEPQEEKPPSETYEDLSFHVPAYTDSGIKICTVTSQGKGASGQLGLDFSVLNGQYIISPTKIGFSCHDIASCDSCGYVNTDLGGAYLFSAQGLDQGGITVTLATPMLASSVTGMTLTFMTTKEAAASSMRILTADQTNNAAFINACASMSGAAEQWTTVDLGVKDFSELADSDGYIRSFQMYFRDKDKVDCYVKSVDFTFSPTDFLSVDEASGNCFFRQGAVQSVAQIIAERFTAADIQAEITVEGTKYRKNSCTSEGTLTYKATAKLADGTTLQARHTATVPAITGVWLDATDGQYGAFHDAKGQWQQTFDPSGMLFLTDNVLTCAEGMNTVEYALVASDAAYDDREIVWIAPQLLEMNEQGFDYLLVNAFLDYGNVLTEGETYRLMVRGVTKQNNYILHIDIPFTYQTLSAQATDALRAAQRALEQTDLICPAQTENKAEYVKEQLAALIHDENISLNIEVLGEGLESMRIWIALRYAASINEARLPAYEMNGSVLTDVYNYTGRAFTKEAMTVRYSDQQSTITLTAPYDGDRHVILAADVIYNHAKSPLEDVQDVNYGYLAGEYCTPVPLTLSWTDANAAEGKTYTVLVSENRDLSDAMELTATQPCAQIEHLKIGTTYYWQVRSDTDASPVQVFTTEDGYPRFIRLDGVSNVRDIGGYITADGKRVKQNLAFRSAQLESITEKAKEIALNTLHIRTDLDLRGGHTTPLGNTVQHISIPMQWYEHIFAEDKYEVVRQTVSAFADPENYPIIFHCSMGRDRTGTATFLILGLLGVDEDTLRHEYYASFFSSQGAFDANEFPLLIINMNRLVEGFDDFGDEDDTLQQKIHAYLLHIGVSEQEIQSICDIWLE